MKATKRKFFLGHSVAQQTNISDETARLIDTEIKHLVESGELKAKEIITSKLKELHIIAKGLLEFETLSAEDITNLLKGKKVKREDNGNSESVDELKKKTKTPNKSTADKKKPLSSVPITVKNTT